MYPLHNTNEQHLKYKKVKYEKWSWLIADNSILSDQVEMNIDIYRCRKLFRFWNILIVHYKYEIRYKNTFANELFI